MGCFGNVKDFGYVYRKSKKLNDIRYRIANNISGDMFVTLNFAEEFEELGDFSRSSFIEGVGKLAGAISSYFGNFVLTRKSIDKVEGGIETLIENRKRGLL
jgi:hypothetical protein